MTTLCRVSLSRVRPRIPNVGVQFLTVGAPRRVFGPGKKLATSSHRRQVGSSGYQPAPGRPATVMTISSPSSTRRTSSDAFWRNSRRPTASTFEMMHMCYRYRYVRALVFGIGRSRLLSRCGRHAKRRRDRRRIPRGSARCVRRTTGRRCRGRFVSQWRDRLMRRPRARAARDGPADPRVHAHL